MFVPTYVCACLFLITLPLLVLFFITLTYSIGSYWLDLPFNLKFASYPRGIVIGPEEEQASLQTPSWKRLRGSYWVLGGEEARFYGHV